MRKIVKRLFAAVMSVLMMLVSFGLSFVFIDKSEVFDIPVFNGDWQGDCLMIDGKTVPLTIAGGTALPGGDAPAFSFTAPLTLTLDDTGKRNFNYFGLRVQSDIALKGTIRYTVLGVAYAEEFFLEATPDYTDFFSFIDGYFKSLKGGAIRSLCFEPLSDGTATLRIAGLALFNRPVLDDEVFVADAFYKIGVHLRWGGSLSYLECLSRNIEAVRTETGVVVAENALARYGGTLINDTVNLINRNDTGRVVQQSYYGSSGVNDDYIQGEFMGQKWPYNPVQGGNQFEEESKLVDCVITDNAIRIKCRPLDWAKSAKDITPSYMEAVYTLEGEYVRVDCRFVDFSPYESVPRGQELPAFYVIEPLNSFRYYGGAAPWSGDNTLSREDALIFWPDAGYPYFPTTENWCAWTNTEAEGFGLGLYVPGINSMLAGVYGRGGTIGADPSRSAPTAYVAAVKTITIGRFKPLTYSYLIAAGDTADIRDTFCANKDIINNLALQQY